MNHTKESVISTSSFRDPAGFIFIKNDELYRQINLCYKDHFDLFNNSGLYEYLVKSEFLIPHTEVPIEKKHTCEAYRIIKPVKIPFISYPYEWCFTQLKDAALLTLNIQKKALEYGMVLKDCSAFNVQFYNGKPIFIDTLSFEKYNEGLPWVAYKQFCEHFIAPLALMAHTDIRLNQWFKINVGGISLDIATKLLPKKTWLKFGLLTHIHLHAKLQKKYANKPSSRQTVFSRNAMLGLIENLKNTILGIHSNLSRTEWADYNNNTNYSDAAKLHKSTLISDFVSKTNPLSVWDMGANDGTYSRICSNKGIFTVSFDIDPVAVEKNYLHIKNNCDPLLLPLILDIANPSGGIGWGNTERDSLEQRGPVGLTMALALIHHLAISNNVPFNMISNYLSKFSAWLIIEFIHKDDSQVQKLLSTRKDIFDKYNQTEFEIAFSSNFKIVCKADILESKRVLYLMKKATG